MIEGIVNGVIARSRTVTWAKLEEGNEVFG